MFNGTVFWLTSCGGGRRNRSMATACVDKSSAPQYRRESQQDGVSNLQKENTMGNRDKRGREKKKPKKTAAAPVSKPYKPIVDYKPPAPATPTPAPAPTTENKP